MHIPEIIISMIFRLNYNISKQEVNRSRLLISLKSSDFVNNDSIFVIGIILYCNSNLYINLMGALIAGPL
jgi:hypothetical protein